MARLRRLFATAGEGEPREATPEEHATTSTGSPSAPTSGSSARSRPTTLRGHRVRRDAVDRIVELVQRDRMARSSAVPALSRALDDPHHLVRRQAFAALEAACSRRARHPAADRAAVVHGGRAQGRARRPRGRGGTEEERFRRVASALDSHVPDARKYAFEVLERISPKGSLEPLLAALRSQHADLRIGVLVRLQTSSDPRVAQALEKALLNDHEDLRLRAAGSRRPPAGPRRRRARRRPALRDRQLPRPGAHRPRAARHVGRRRALARRLSRRAPRATGTRRINALSRFRGEARVPTVRALIELLASEDTTVRRTAFDAALQALGTREDAEKLRRPNSAAGAPARGAPGKN
ncbi:MAG: HEAT repeat domain-containing protein [Myxococcota bacterium]